MFKPKTLPQPELFVPSVRLVQPATSSFYTKLDQTLASFQFGDKARQICAAAYSDSKRGRPGVDPVVYFKMLMIGFFENISSERGIAERCSDSISIRFFLGYDLTQSTPDHSTLSVIRDRLGEETYQKVFLVILSALQEYGLLKGRQVGIDASVIEANAALKSLVNRNTEEAYWDFVRRLASENAAVRCSSTTNRLPPPGSASQNAVPPCRMAIWRTRERPRPHPPEDSLRPAGR